LHRQVQIVDGGPLAVALGQALQFDHRWHTLPFDLQDKIGAFDLHRADLA
jgi:hypothetical protein